MAETHAEPFAKRAAQARGAKAPGPGPQHVISVPANAVPIFVFLHSPKTAGTTMRGMFNDMFGRYFHLFTAAHDEKRGQDGKRGFEQPGYYDNILMLAGHFHRTHAVVNGISGRRSVFVSVMRDPVKRVVSHYDYIRRMPGHRLHSEVRDCSLHDAFAAGGAFRKVCENEQLRIMFGARLQGGIEAALRQDNYIIGTLDHLLPITQAVAALSGMHAPAEVPSFNRIEDLGGENIERARDQADFGRAQKLIRAANASEYEFYERVARQMIVTIPGWTLPAPARAATVSVTAAPAAKLRKTAAA
jgi:hypothetical protein